MSCEFFVWRIGPDEIYRCYGTRNHIEPEISDRRCVWRGNGGPLGTYKDGVEFAKLMNDGRHGGFI